MTVTYYKTVHKIANDLASDDGWYVVLDNGSHVGLPSGRASDTVPIYYAYVNRSDGTYPDGSERTWSRGYSASVWRANNAVGSTMRVMHGSGHAVLHYCSYHPFTHHNNEITVYLQRRNISSIRFKHENDGRSAWRFDDIENNVTTGGKRVEFSYSDGAVLEVEEQLSVIGLVSLTY